MSERPSLEIRESHITDGQINASVMLGEEVVGSVYLNLSQWDTLRQVYGVKVLNLGEQSEEDDSGE